MKPNNIRLSRCNSPHRISQREAIESELAALPKMLPAVSKLISAEGFIDYYLSMQDLYPSYREAYERLEDFHISVTGRRRYSEFSSFKKVLDRQMKKYRNAPR